MGQELLLPSESCSDYLIVLLGAIIIRGVVIDLLIKLLLFHLKILRRSVELHLSVDYLFALIYFPKVLFLRWDSGRLREFTLHNVHILVAVLVFFNTLIHHILL